MRYAVAAASAILTITALCDIAVAGGAAGIRGGGGVRPSTGYSRGISAYKHSGQGGSLVRSYRATIICHSSRGSSYSHFGKAVGWRYVKDHGWRRHQHNQTPQPASATEFVPSSPYRFLADEPGRYLGSGAF
jgi:hypothetical protein